MSDAGFRPKGRTTAAPRDRRVCVIVRGLDGASPPSWDVPTARGNHEHGALTVIQASSSFRTVVGRAAAFGYTRYQGRQGLGMFPGYSGREGYPWVGKIPGC